MADPCIQSETIKFIGAKIDDLHSEYKETNHLLRTIATQGEQIKSLIGRTDTAEKDIEHVYDRLRKAEDSVTRHDAYILDHRQVTQDFSVGYAKLVEEVRVSTAYVNEQKTSDAKWEKRTTPIIAGAILTFIAAVWAFIANVAHHVQGGK